MNPFEIKLLLLLYLILGGVGSIFSQSNTEVEITSTIDQLEAVLLSKSPTIQQLFLNVKSNEANLLSSQSIFDVLLTGETSYGRDRRILQEGDPLRDFYSNTRTNSGDLTLGLQKVFRNSTLLSGQLSWSRISDSNPFDVFGNQQTAFTAQNTARFSFGLQQPLLRGRGRSVVTANETARKLQVEAVKADLVQASATEVLNLHLVYWQYLSAYKIYAIYQENESRVRRMLEITQTLIDAEKKPRAEIIQVRADLADQESQTIFARQALLEAQQNLGRIMGLEMDEAADLGDPIEEFPLEAANRILAQEGQEMLFGTALKNRQDLQSFAFNLNALTNLVALTKNELLPQLDAKLSFNYGGLRVGNDYTDLIRAFSTVPGQQVGGQIGLAYQFPLQNRAAKAAYAQQQLFLQDQQINYDNLQRNIKINVQIALNNLQQSQQALEKSRSSYTFYQEAFDNESKKFQAGLTTLLNLIIFQDRLTSIHIRYIQSQQQLAEFWSTLQFEMGSIISETGLEYLNNQVED